MRVTHKGTLLQNATMPKGRTSKVEVGDRAVFALEKLVIATDYFQIITDKAWARWFWHSIQGNCIKHTFFLFPFCCCFLGVRGL